MQIIKFLVYIKQFKFLNDLIDMKNIIFLNKFKNFKRAYYSFLFLGIFFFLSLFAEWIANDKPILLVYKNNWYFPIVKTYNIRDFSWYFDNSEYKQIKINYKKIIADQKGDLFVIKPLFFWGYNESNREVHSYPSRPTLVNILGTDDRGRDVLTRMIYGFRTSILFALIYYFICMLIATFIGSIQGYYAGFIDIVGQRFIEIIDSVPYLFVLILIKSIYDPGFVGLAIFSALFSWLALSYYIRAEALRVRKEDYVTAAKSIGASQFYILRRHIIPNSLTPLITFTPFILANGVLLLSTLDFLGFGLQPPTASLGELIKQGKENFLTAWWLGVYPVGGLTLVILLLTFIGEGIRTAFDPRSD